MKKLLAVLLTAAMTMAMLTACGSSTEATDTTTETTEAEADTTTDDAAVEETAEAADAADAAEETADTEAAVSEALADGMLTAGTNAEFPPFEYVGDDGEADGFDIALIKAIGEKLGVDVQVDNMEFASLVSSIGNKIDVAIAGMTITDEAVDFSEPYYEAVQYVLLPEGSEIATAEDLKNKTIGVQLGTTGDFIASDIEGTTVNTYNKGVDAVNDLINGRVDCVIIDKNPALVFESKFQDDGSKITAVDGAQFEFEPEYYAIAVPKGDTALVDAINKAIEELKADGTFDELVKTYIEE